MLKPNSHVEMERVSIRTGSVMPMMTAATSRMSLRPAVSGAVHSNVVHVCSIFVYFLNSDTTCSDGEIVCPHNSGAVICIDPEWMCDDDMDCPDGWDENRTAHNCSIRESHACTYILYIL